ncbi:MAG: bifunctional folylpolyglutamate synthase/dihydrofolate synthase [Oscillospiraceae bacterium]|nr:bifunctional folylpolyglutamate synthase/dihydrofolate synthase [Oscillospiraceae bacterium]
MKKEEIITYYTDTPKDTHEPGLSVMRTLMARLGNPQASLRCVHIAGTNGKGSCAAMLSAVLRAAGHRTGLFTSPDLNGLWERIQIDGESIPLSALEAVTRQVRRAAAGLPEPSFFEKLTAAAFLYFQQERCDYVVLETGLGGRLDATNIIRSPACAVIMPIGFDHMDRLGPDIAAIAGEKAGIIKPGCPVVCAGQPPEAEAVIRAVSQERGAPLYMTREDRLTVLSESPAGQVISYDGLENIVLSLAGAYQSRNACAVIETARVLNVEEKALRAGLGAAKWPCRFEYFPGHPPFLLDGAHNPHGAAALAQGLARYFPGERFTFLLGAMGDKDCQGIVDALEPLAARFICLAPDSPRAMPPADLAALVRAAPTRCATSLEEATALARQHQEPVCACGSLYYVGALRKKLMEETEHGL